MALIQDAVVAMKNSGIEQWDEIYPSIKEIDEDIESESAFGFFNDGKLIAYIALNDKYSPEYDSANWITKGKSLIVHRLSVAPSQQGKALPENLCGLLNNMPGIMIIIPSGWMLLWKIRQR